MDGVCRPAGSGVPVVVDGETLILPAMTLKDLGVVEQKLLLDRPDPLAIARKHVGGLPPELAEKLLGDAYDDAKRNYVSNEEMGQYLDSMTGITVAVWVLFHRAYPDRFKTTKDVQDLFERLPPSELQNIIKAFNQAAAWDERGNSTGQSKEEAPQTEQSDLSIAPTA